MSDAPDLVLEALKKPGYDWKTVESIVRDTRLSGTDVALILETFVRTSEVVRSRDTDGTPIYTTRAHYMRKGNLMNRTLSVLADRIK